MKRNIIVLALSDIRTNVDKKVESCICMYKDQFEFDDSRGQLEPIVRMFMNNHKNEEIEVIILCTSETTENKKIIIDETYPEGIKFSAYEYFKYRINIFAQEFNCTVDYECVPLSENAPEYAISAVVEKVSNWNKQLSNTERGEFWIDTHGSFRNISVLLNAIISLLKVEGIYPNEVFGVQTMEGIIYIVDQFSSFQIFEFVSGMNDFINFGNADVLANFFHDEKDGEVKNVVDSMKYIADALSICDPQKYRQGLNNLANALNSFVPHEQSGKEILLNIFKEYICQDFYPLLEKDKSKRTNLEIVKRCVKKKQYQQALTFMESMMPEQIYKSNDLKFNIDREKLKELNNLDWKNDKNFIIDSYTANVYVKGRKYNNYSIVSLVDQYGKYYEKLNKNKEYVHKKITGISELPKNVDFRHQTFGTIDLNKLNNTNKQEWIEFLCLHHVLKQCRNEVNHSSLKARPTVKQISNCLNLYVLMAEDLLVKNK